MDATKTDNVVQLDRVRCLECGATYIKPSGGGTVSQNPGCPKCGYLGWIAASIPTSPAALRRFAEDRIRRRAARPR
jgi:ribosomal protein S27AE